MNMLERNLAFNLGGDINHSAFWPNMSPNGGDKPDGAGRSRGDLLHAVHLRYLNPTR